MRDDRGPWYLLTGLILGAVMGLLYSWVVSPLRYVDTDPSSLRQDFKDEYRSLIAAAYMATGDLGRARARLALLGDADSYRLLAEQAQRELARGGAPDEARALGALAAALNQAGVATAPAGQTASPTVLPPSPTDPAPTVSPTAAESRAPSPSAPAIRTQRPSLTPAPTGTAQPTATATATPGLPYELVDQSVICDSDLAGPLLQVVVSDAAGNPVPGVEVIVTWPEGEERFFTGLKPEFGLGYADYGMTPEVVYAVQVEESGEIVEEITAEDCNPLAGQTDWGLILLEFAQP